MDKPLGPLPTRGLAREELSPARRAALDVLIDLGGRRTVAELAEELGQHPNTVREHLEALVRTGLAERSLRHSTGRGRPAALYRATLAATPAGPEYAVLAEVLIGYLARVVPDPEDRVRHALAAGRDWGRAIRERQLVDASREERLAAAGIAPGEPATGEAGPADLGDSVARLGEMLDRAGFDCRTTREPTGGYTQRLRRCPVLSLAREHPDIVCTSHLGMAQEILGTEGVAAERVTLEAFAEPGACLLRIAPPAADDE